MAKFAAVALGVAGVLGDDAAKYAEWSNAYGSNGGEDEFQVFVNNLRLFEEAQANDPSAVYDHMGPFSAISAEKFNVRLGTLGGIVGATQGPILEVSTAVASYDWRDHGAVNAIKDQSQCGSCWAFSAVANLEGVLQVSAGKLMSLSEQQLVDCDTADSGCLGGNLGNAQQWMMDNGVGEETESAYPYDMSQTEAQAHSHECRQDVSQYQVYVSGWHQISTDETQIAAALTQYGPLSIAVNANKFQSYRSGVADPFLCNGAMRNHGVAIVGFGTDGKDYWTIRNSWGTSWGEDGYIRQVRGKGSCGLNRDVVTATGATIGPAAGVVV